MMSLLSAGGLWAAAAVAVTGLIAWFAAMLKRSGRQAQQVADQQQSTKDVQTRSGVDAKVASESDAAVVVDLRRQRSE